MSEEELIEATTEEAATETEEEAEDIEEAIDINAALLEVMVKRTELLEQLMRGSATLETTMERLESVRMPSLDRRRRR